MRQYQSQVYSIRIEVRDDDNDGMKYNNQNATKRNQHCNDNCQDTQHNNQHTIQQSPNPPLHLTPSQHHYQNLLTQLNQLQQQLIQSQTQLNYHLNYHLKPQFTPDNSLSQPVKSSFPILKILKNHPYNYLSKLPDTRLSNKRYLNMISRKVEQFPKVGVFEVYFENLMVFSKAGFGGFPEEKLIRRIIKVLVQYCETDGVLMARLAPFVNQYLDIRPVLGKDNKLSLYEYLILTSNCDNSHDLSQTDQNVILNNLKNIISGATKIIYPLQNNPSQLLNPTREILPYSLVSPKLKTHTMSSIYMGINNKQKNPTKRIKQSALSFSVSNRLHHQKTTSTTFHSSNRPVAPKSKPTRPLSSNLGYLRKTSSGYKSKQVFDMIKIGEYEQNVAKTSNDQTVRLGKMWENQLEGLCRANSPKIFSGKKDNSLKHTKLYLNDKFRVKRNETVDDHKTQVDQGNHHEEHNDSIVWTKFDKPNEDVWGKGETHRGSMQRRKSSQLFKDALNLHNDQDFPKLGQSNGLKITPSKKLQRASLFLNQRQSNQLAAQLKNMQQISEKSHRETQKSTKNKTPAKKSSTSSNKSIKSPKRSNSQSSNSSRSSSETSSATSSHSQVWPGQIQPLDKLKVLKHTIEKRRSSQASENSSVSNNQQEEDHKIEIQRKKPLNHHGGNHSLMIQPANSKLSVRSRRKSSFYYSNSKNNGLLELLAHHEHNPLENNQGDDNMSKKVSSKRHLQRPSERQSRVSAKSARMKVQEGVQVDFERDLCDQNTGQANQPFLKTLQMQRKPSDAQPLNSKTSLPAGSFHNLQHQPQDSKKPQQPRQSTLIKNIRDSRVSSFSRISKFSFQNHFSNLKDPLNVSREKELSEEMVAVFPQNRFAQAFIVQKFTQKDFYELQVKKMFTTNLQEKSEVFDFQISCSELVRSYELRSLSKVYETSQKKLCLFPKIFQQVQNYSTPLAQVVNRLLKFHPIALSRLFTNAHGISPLGQYCIWLYHTAINQFRPVYINDTIPVYDQELEDPAEFMMKKERKSIPCYGPITNENSIWFVLLEKAMAKVVGGYYSLSQTPIAELFSMITGCPVVNVKNFTEGKLVKIFNEKVFQNKKAYVYALTTKSPQSMRIDRVLGVQTPPQPSHHKPPNPNPNPPHPLILIQQKQSTQSLLSLPQTCLLYSQICLVFFNLNHFFNQVSLPTLPPSQHQTSNLISFYLINQHQQKNSIFLILGNFLMKKSKITIYKESQQEQNTELRQLQATDPLMYYENKYTYIGEIQKYGDYFFQTQLKYGKYLCLVQCSFQVQHKYYLSTYSSHPMTIHETKHNFTESAGLNTDPLEKVITANRLRRKLRKQHKEHLDAIKEDQLPTVIQYPVRVVYDDEELEEKDQVVPYDFRDYRKKKEEMAKSRKYEVKVSKKEDIGGIPSKWVIEKQFIEDEDYLQEQKQRQISSIINHIQKVQQKQQNAKLKKQLKTNQKDAVLKMMSKIDQNAKKLNHEDQQLLIKTRRRKLQQQQLLMQQKRRAMLQQQKQNQTHPHFKN